MTSRVDEREVVREALTAPNVVVYHWDADGMIGAIHTVMANKDRSVLLPPRFTYKPGRDYIKTIAEFSEGKDYVVLIDINFSRDVIREIVYSIKSMLVVIDHHVSKTKIYHNRLVYVNPAFSGDPDGKWPSASHVLASYLGDYNPLLIAASIVGDLGEKAKANTVYQNYMVEAGLDPVRDFDIPRIIADNLDSVGIMGNYEALTWIPRVHAIGDRDPAKSIIDDPYLINLKVQADIELEELIDEVENNAVVEGIVVYSYVEGEGRHISKLSRHLASLYPDKITVVGYVSRNVEMGYVYVRTMRDDIDLTKLIEMYEGKVISIGGKRQKMNNVIGMEVDTGKVREIMNIVVNDVKRLLVERS